MNRLKVMFAILFAVIGIASAFSTLRVQTVRFEKQTALSKFTKITSYVPSLCQRTETNCTYITVWQDNATIPQDLPLNASPGNPAGLISITADGNAKLYVDGDPDE